MRVTDELSSLSPHQDCHTRLVQVFTGDGRGKTSAALGTALRAAGHRLRIHVVFFMKGEFPYGEQKILSSLPNTTFERFGFTRFVNPESVQEEEKEEARKALEAARQAIASRNYDMVIMDEINVAAAWKLIDVEQVVELIKEKPQDVELILTGRYADPKITECADLVTEMVNRRHPCDRGILARKGFDC
jgi:cob(I)alamin adenosyltransferase